MSDEIKGLFLEEAEELFENITPSLLEAEESGVFNEESINLVFRNVHTLKGGAGSVGFDLFTEYVHHLETFMDRLRNNEIKPNKEIIGFLLEELDKSKTILEEETEDEIDFDRFRQDLKTLKDKVAQFTLLAKTKKDRKDINIAESGAEIVDLFDELIHLLNVAKHEGIEAVKINEVFRLVHTLKGDSIFLSLSYFPAYMHELESLFDRVRSNQLKFDQELVEFLLDEASNAQDIIDSEINNLLKEDVFNEKLKVLKTNMEPL